MFQGIPRILIVLGVVLIAIIELAARLPDLVLLPQKMQAALGEYDAKAMQPKVVTTQVEKTEADTRLAQMQAALAATQAQKTQAETQLADAQTAKTNLEVAQKTMGLALTVGVLGAGAKLFGMMTQPQDTTQTAQPATATATQPSNPAIEAGRSDWQNWYNWGMHLPQDQKDGANYWATVRGSKSAQSCKNAARQLTDGFIAACEDARKYLTVIDQRRANDDYRQGWTAGFKETGGF